MAGGDQIPDTLTMTSIKEEIQRFESVHPCIYAIYDLIETIGNRELKESIHNHLVTIEDAFVNSQEWTLNRHVKELKLGVVGSPESGKSALVHRFLTGAYLQDASPEGGRFKYSVPLNGTSHLMLIRDEAEEPSQQFAMWCDVCIFVFAMDKPASLDTAAAYCKLLAQFRDLTALPILVVGTRDSTTDSRARMPHEAGVMELANAAFAAACGWSDLAAASDGIVGCFEASAAYGYNVEKVFMEACRAALAEHSNSRTPATTPRRRPQQPQPPPTPPARNQPAPEFDTKLLGLQRTSHRVPQDRNGSTNLEHQRQQKQQEQILLRAVADSSPTVTVQLRSKPAVPHRQSRRPSSQLVLPENSAAAAAAPHVTLRPKKPLRRAASVVSESRHQNPVAMRVQQVATEADRQLTMDKSVSLVRGNPQPQQQQQLLQPEADNLKQPEADNSRSHRQSASVVSIPLPQRPIRNTRSSQQPQQQQQQQQAPQQQRRSVVMATNTPSQPAATDSVSVGPGRAIPVKQGVLMKRSTGGLSSEWRRKFVTLGEDGQLTYYASLHEYMENGKGRSIDLGQATVRLQDNQHHHHKRGKSGENGGGESPAVCSGFQLVTLDGKVRQFEAPSRDIRDAWVDALRAATLGRLRAAEAGGGDDSGGSGALLVAARAAPGNETCADCGDTDPLWASVSLGLLLCIKCCGAHRQLGTHLSRVRSLHLDSWTVGHALPLSVVGNRLGNSVWEARLPPGRRPGPEADSVEREAFARAKYERGEFLPPADSATALTLSEVSARGDTRRMLVAMARATSADLDAAAVACATAGRAGHLQILLWRGANPRARDPRGRSAGECAAAGGHSECERLLRAAASQSG